MAQAIDDHRIVTDQLLKSGDEIGDALQLHHRQQDEEQASTSSSPIISKKISDRGIKSPEKSEQRQSSHQKKQELQVRKGAPSPSKKTADAKKLDTGFQIDSQSAADSGRLFPFFMDTPIPRTVTPLCQLMQQSYRYPSYAVEATAVDCSFTHQAICDLVHVRCGRCQFTESLQDRLGLQDTGDLTGSEFEAIGPIPCPNGCESDGKQVHLGFVFNLFFVIRDKSGQKMVVCLSTFSAIKLFGVSPKDALIKEAKRETVFKILEAICPKNLDDRADNFLMWLLKPYAIGKTATRFFVLTVTSGCSASKAPAT